MHIAILRAKKITLLAKQQLSERQAVKGSVVSGIGIQQCQQPMKPTT
jgi:hypothetical protein